MTSHRTLPSNPTGGRRGATRGPAVRRLARYASAPGRAALGALLALAALLLGPMPAPMAAAATGAPAVSFSCNNGTGVNYTVPTGITRLYVMAGGGAGAGPGLWGGDGGAGGSVKATVSVSPGDTLVVLAGCSGRRVGGGYGKGARGGHSGTEQNGSRGGGGSAVLRAADSSPLVVAGGGGGGGGKSGLGNGGNGGAGSQNGEDGQRGDGTSHVPGGKGGAMRGTDGDVGWKSTGGGGGGGGGGGYHGGGGGHGGSCVGCGGGGGGSSYVISTGTGATFTTGNVTGDGYVFLVPLTPRGTASATVFGCNGGAAASYQLPSDASRLIVMAAGAGGEIADKAAAPGAGARVQATVPVAPGALLQPVVGCQGGGGYGSGGRGGSSAPNNYDGAHGGGGSALLDAGGTPLVVAGGGGGGGGAGAFTGGGQGGDGSQGGQNGTGGGGSGGGHGGSGGNQSGTNGSRGGNSSAGAGGGGGGGGYHGGEGGDHGDTGSGGGGGGGGSSFVAPAATNATISTGANQGDGMIVLVVEVASPPDPPTGVRATASLSQATVYLSLGQETFPFAEYQQATVTFTPPASDGGNPITSYTVTSSPGGITATGAASPIKVSSSSFNSGNAYTFTVHATNAAGNGAESQPSNPAVVVIPPGAPPGAAAWPGNGNAAVSWLPPPDNGAPITSYTIVASPDATHPNGITLTVPPPQVDSQGHTNPVVVSGLTNGTSYAFAVAATNLAGTGPAASTNAVTPQAASGPANDNFASAQAISGASGSATGSNIGASKEAGEPDHAGNPGGASIWYVWVAPAGYHTITFTTCGSNFDTLLADYFAMPGTTPAVDTIGTFGAVAANDNGGCAPALVQSTITHELNPAGGDTYYVAIDGHNAGGAAAAGSTVLNWRAQ